MSERRKGKEKALLGDDVGHDCNYEAALARSLSHASPSLQLSQPGKRGGRVGMMTY